MSQEDCELQGSGTMPAGCTTRLRDAAQQHWVSGVLLWFLKKLPQRQAVCEADQHCFELPACGETYGPASFLILSSVRHLFDVFKDAYDSVFEARSYVEESNLQLHDAIAWVAKPVEEDYRAKILLMLAPLASTMVDPPASTIVMYLGWALPQMIMSAPKDHQPPATPELKAFELNRDLAIFADGLQELYKLITRQLFHQGYIDIGNNKAQAVYALVGNGVYSEQRNTNRSENVAAVRKLLGRSIVLSSYRRQDFHLYFA